MYVTRPLSLYKKSPESLATPPEGPNSGYLVVQDEEPETSSCCGLCTSRVIKDLPLPQNKDLTVRYVQSYGAGAYYVYEKAVFIPVLGQPLSSNRYYVIHHGGNHKGEAYTCSKEEDRRNFCFFKSIKDVKPKPLNPGDIYQQMEVGRCKSSCPGWRGFYATSVAPDGFPPQLLRSKGWDIRVESPAYFRLGEALGLNASLRARLPSFNFPLSQQISAPVVVGKWYCPFVFIKDGHVADQVELSPFYEMTLEQRWEEIYSCYSNSSNNIAVTMDIMIQSPVVSLYGNEVMWDLDGDADGVTWFQSANNGGERTIGLSTEVIQGMKWEQERGGWRQGKGSLVRVKRVEEFEGFGDWNRFGCYILVERFVLKRVDRSLLLTFDFKHSDKLRTKWE